ncbi:MAG TPA: hypothetical protein PK566_18635 [Pseudobacteroides sp.]|nr:hypothetical protein [Pseudobacteroides sp.]
MGIKHLLLEVYCDCEDDIDEPSFCHRGSNFPGIHCFENNCKFLSYTYCPNEISYSSELGLIESMKDCIGYGGDMLPKPYDEETQKNLVEKWKQICIRKISEAYNEYMNYKKQIGK